MAFLRKVILLLIAVVFVFLSIQSKEIVFFNEKAFIAPPVIEEIKLFAVGDIMLDRGVEYMVKKHGGGDYRFPFLNMDLRESDILFGNLETVISNRGEKVGSIYSFRSDIESIEGLKYAGFNVVSLANNHALDYQRVALEDTMSLLKENNIDYVGAGYTAKEAFSVKIKEIKGTKIGFLAYTNLGSIYWRAGEKSTGLAWISKKEFPYLKENIIKAKEKVDILIVSLHAGAEYTPLPNSFQEEFAYLVIDAGADLVLGHHPHVIQPLEKYQDGWIIYSLGNFVFDQAFSEETMKGGLLKAIISNKKIQSVSFEEIQMNGFYQPSRN